MSDTQAPTPDSGGELKPCPFCGAGETDVSETHLPPRMSGPGALISVTVRHWCAKSDGVVSRLTQFTGRDHATAIAAWNRRSTDTRSEVLEEKRIADKITKYALDKIVRNQVLEEVVKYILTCGRIGPLGGGPDPVRWLIEDHAALVRSSSGSEVRAAALEEAAKVADGFGGTGCGALVAEHIRALSQFPPLS